MNFCFLVLISVYIWSAVTDRRKTHRIHSSYRESLWVALQAQNWSWEPHNWVNPHMRVAEKNRWQGRFLTFLGVQLPVLTSTLLDNGVSWARQHIDLSVQFGSVTQLCPALCNPMDCSTPGLPVHHPLSEFMQTHVHWVGDSIQPSHPLSSPSPPPSTFPSIRVFSNESVLCIRLWSLMSVPTHWP